METSPDLPWVELVGWALDFVNKTACLDESLRIHRLPIDQNFVVYVRAGATPGAAELPDDRAMGDAVAFLYLNSL